MNGDTFPSRPLLHAPGDSFAAGGTGAYADGSECGRSADGEAFADSAGAGSPLGTGTKVSGGG